MNASIALLLEGIGSQDAMVFDHRGSRDGGPFDIRCSKELLVEDEPSLDPDVLYVASSAVLEGMADRLCNMSVAVAGGLQEGDILAGEKRCRLVTIPGIGNVGELHNRLIDAQRRLDDLDMRLTWASLERDSLGAMLDVMAKELGEPLLATDSDDVLAAYAVPDGLEVADAVFCHIRENNCILPDTPFYDAFIAAMPEGEEMRDAVQLVSVPEARREYLNAMMLRDGEPILDILMSDEGKPFGRSTADMLLRLKHLVEQAIRLGSPLGFPPPDRDSCVRRLLDHIFVREEIIEGYLHKHAWHMDDRFYCVLAQVEGPNAPAILSPLARQLRMGVLRGAIVLVHGGEVACVVQADSCPYDMARLSEGLGAIAKRFSAKVGVSCPFHDFRELRRYYDSCRTAISYGVREEPPRSVSFFDDYAARHLEKVLFGRSVNEVLLDARAYDIKRHDDEQDSDLLRTLLTYLECGQNKTLASQRLFIHRNTFIYRIGTIERVAGIDLSTLDADRLFHLMYTCRYLLSRERV